MRHGISNVSDHRAATPTSTISTISYHRAPEPIVRSSLQ